MDLTDVFYEMPGPNVLLPRIDAAFEGGEWRYYEWAWEGAGSSHGWDKSVTEGETTYGVIDPPNRRASRSVTLHFRDIVTPEQRGDAFVRLLMAIGLDRATAEAIERNYAWVRGELIECAAPRGLVLDSWFSDYSSAWIIRVKIDTTDTSEGEERPEPCPLSE